MMSDELVNRVKEYVNAASNIVIVQADNPDADSLGSALALEQILGDLDKNPALYCGVDMPGYLKYLRGWDRVMKDLPKQIDLGIVVDASTSTLLQKLAGSGQQGWLASKPVIVLDHHAEVTNDISFARVVINDPKSSSTGELIYKLSQKLGWPVSKEAMEFIMTAILGDTQGLSNHLATAETYRIMAELVDGGVDRPALEELRRESSKMSQSIYSYKAELIKRTEFDTDGLIAHVTVPQTEISEFSPLYNPGPLIQGDMLQVEGVGVAIVFKHYDDGKITGTIRCNPTYGIGSDLALHFGGGGHAYASGFKVTDGRSMDEIKTECLAKAEELLKKIN